MTRALRADGRGVRRAPQQVDVAIGPVGNGVHAPASQPAMREVGEPICPTVAVFSCEVCAAEIEGSIGDMIFVIAAYSPVALAEERCQRRRFFRQLGKQVLAIADGRRPICRTNARGSVRPEETAFGIDEPPLAVVLFDAEEAGCLELWAGAPATVLVPRFGAWIRRQISRFLFDSAGKVGIVANLSRPILVDELAVTVDHGKQGIRRVRSTVSVSRLLPGNWRWQIGAPPPVWPRR